MEASELKMQLDEALSVHRQSAARENEQQSYWQVMSKYLRVILVLLCNKYNPGGNDIPARPDFVLCNDLGMETPWNFSDFPLICIHLCVIFISCYSR